VNEEGKVVSDDRKGKKKQWPNTENTVSYIITTIFYGVQINPEGVNHMLGRWLRDREDKINWETHM